MAALVREGRPIDSASAIVGVHRASFFEWMQKGRAASERRDQGEELAARDRGYVEFVEAVTHARAEAESRAVGVVWAAMERDWRAAAWFLEHSLPDRWGRQGRSAIDVVHHGEPELQAQLVRGREIRVEAERRLALPAGVGPVTTDDSIVDQEEVDDAEQ